MRSRYSAYVLQNRDYLLRTWHPDTRPKDIEFEAGIKWLGLEVRKHITSNTVTQDSALVEFVARYRVGGKGQRLHEQSYFVKLNGSWFYSHGDMLA
jgi:SEC-C motif-containing protein